MFVMNVKSIIYKITEKEEVDDKFIPVIYHFDSLPDGQHILCSVSKKYIS